VTSEILTPETALQKFNFVRQKIENLSVVGIAGPGDALANWDQTRKTIHLIKEADPDVVFCLSTNGLMLPEYAREIVDLGLKHVTVTVNCLDPEIGGEIYRFVNYKGTRYAGVAGARLLIDNQLAGIELLAAQGTVVKVNIVMVKGINDRQIPDVVRKVKNLGAYITNIMPLIPAQGSAFEHFPQTSMKDVNQMREICQVDLQQMYHCKQCRADAIGLLGNDRSMEFRLQDIPAEPSLVVAGTEKQYKIAVASTNGTAIDQHFGHAAEFAIFEGDGKAFELVERRKVRQYCTESDDGEVREPKKEYALNVINDCDAVVSLRVGHQAREKLRKNHILGLECYDTVENGLKFAVRKLNEKEAV